MSQLVAELPTLTRRKERALSRNVLLHAAMLCVWLLLFLVMTCPKEDIDFGSKLRKIKLAGRASSLLLLLGLNYLAISRTPLRFVFRAMIGFIGFFAFACLSVTWSPLPQDSLIQCFGLFIMLLIAATIAHLSRTKEHVRIVLFHLTAAIMAQGVVMMTLQFMTGTAVGRDDLTYFHSTDAANNFGLGTILLVGAVFILKLRWAKLLLIPGLIILFSLGAMSHNRLSIVITPAVLILVMMIGANRKILFTLFFAGIMLLPLLLICDAQTGSVRQAFQASEKVAVRGENAATGGFNGRDKLWALIWDEYKQKPLGGNGYMMTSSTGTISVWNKVRNYDAHNQIFHVLASTGLFGLMLFLWGMFTPTRFISVHWNKLNWRGEFARYCSLVFLWLFLWGLLNVSFSGYMNCCSIVFYSLLGLIIGCLSRKPDVQ